MTDVTLQDAGTFPAQSYVKSYFSNLPTDLKFTSTQVMQVNAGKHIKDLDSSMDFVFEKLEEPYAYNISDMLLQATIIITKADGKTLPEPTAMVAPVNNVIGSLFSTMTMRINDDIVTQNPGNYPYKCYLKQLLTYDEGTKDTQLQIGGYLQDQVMRNNKLFYNFLYTTEKKSYDLSVEVYKFCM